MKNFFASLVILLGIQSAQATSLHPCTPIVQAKPTTITCVEKDYFYITIEINTVMSDVRRCPVKDMVERNSAEVRLSDINGNNLKTAQLKDGEFSYTLSGPEGVTFKTTDGSLDLKKCSTPSNGGFSVGNGR